MMGEGRDIVETRGLGGLVQRVRTIRRKFTTLISRITIIKRRRHVLGLESRKDWKIVDILGIRSRNSP